MKRILTLLAFVALTITANAVIQSGSCGWNGDNVTFVLNDDGTLVISGSGNMKDYMDYDSSPWYDNRDKIIKVQIEDGVTSIGWDAFFVCSSLTSVTIPNSVTSIGSYAFSGCSRLTSITIPNSVKSIGNYAFQYCRGLTSITIPNSVTSIGSSAFYECSALTSVTIPNSVTSIGDYAFSNCSGLTSITIPNSVTSIGYAAFYFCTGLTSVTIGNSVKSIGYRAFYGCSGLTSITVEEGNSNYDSRDNCNAIIETSSNKLMFGCQNTVIPNSVTIIGEGAFYYCSGLTSVAIPNSVTSIGNGAFYECSGLTSVIIPNSVTRIENYAFSGCSGLTSVTIPNSVTSIGFSAFYGCSGLKEIHSQAITPPDAYYETFNGVNTNHCKLYVPIGTKGTYASARGWKEFINIIEDGTTAITLSEISDKYGDVEFYTLNGVKVDVPNKSGIYVVKKNGETKMVVVKK
ncbi:MAG: leucine-rich repeat domain-containing protein [Bacteroidaceae bacterium]|nr:leucine-rich repeat domain-containing protein [Bacteroidaceae bacterium]